MAINNEKINKRTVTMEVNKNQIAATLKPDNVRRIASIDIFRALTMFLMIFVNDLWSVSGVPHWMEHAAFDEDMLGLSDIVFPSFLFILGMSIPLAIEKRLAKGESKATIVKHIIIRSFALLVMGLFSVNSGSGLASTVGIIKPVFSLIMVICFFIIWNNYPKTESKIHKNFQLVMKIIAAVVLIILAVIYRDPSGGYFQPRWWGILGLIGWTYLLCALIYLFFRKQRYGLILSGLFFIVLCIAGSNKWLGIFSGIIPSNGCFHAFTMVGLFLSLVMTQPESKLDIKKKIMYSSIIGIIFILAGWISNKWWIISKLQETPPWLFYCTGISILFYLFIYWLTDIKDNGRLFNIIKPAGTATLTCYLVPSILYALFALTGFTRIGFMSDGIAGLIKCVCFSFIVVAITALLGKINIKLKI